MPKKKKKVTVEDSQSTAVESSAGYAQDETQGTDVVMAVDSQEATRVDEVSQVPTEIDETAVSDNRTWGPAGADYCASSGWKPGANRLGALT